MTWKNIQNIPTMIILTSKIMSIPSITIMSKAPMTIPVTMP